MRENLQIGHAYLLPQQPITSVAEFARVLRDDIIPLIEEYCYDNFATLEGILGSKLVEPQMRDDLFEANREEDLIQAVFFDELQTHMLTSPVNGDADESDLALDGEDSNDVSIAES